MLPPADCVARCLRKNIKDGGAPASPQRDGSPNEKISRARRPRGKLEKCVNVHVLTQDRHIPFLFFLQVCVCVCGVQGQMRWLSVWGILMSSVRWGTGPVYQLPFALGVTGEWTSRRGRHFELNHLNVRQIVFNKTANNLAFFLISVIYLPSASSLYKLYI